MGKSTAGRIMAEMVLPRIDPKKNTAAKKGLLLINWAQIQNQSPAVIIYRGPKHSAFHGKATHWAAKPPALCSCHLSRLLLRELLGLKLNPQN